MKPKMLLLVMVASAANILTSPLATAQQMLPGHLPDAVARLGLQPIGRLGGTNHLSLAIGLPLRNRESLAELLQQLYDPASTNYHHYLKPEQFAERFGPTAEDYQAVIAFAKRNGFEVTAIYPNRTLLDVRASVADIENALHVRLWRYQHPTEQRTFFAPDGELAFDLAVPVLHIAGLDDVIKPRPLYHIKAQNPGMIGTPKGTASSPAAGSAPGGGFMGNDFRAAYVPGVVLTGTGQTVGLVEFDSGFYPGDITNYESQAGLPNVPVTPVLVDGYDGSPGGLNENAEVSLDIEMAIAMAPGLDQVLVYEGSQPNDILNCIATNGVANQISASWGYSIDASTEQIYQQFAAQGQSFFNASGDGDAWLGPIPYGCLEDSNITIVGGTTLATSGPGGSWVSETVWNWGYTGATGWNPDGYVGSSGGISTRVNIPDWQQGINMSANHGSTTRRNLPDVALTADNIYVVYYNGAAGVFGGTSCAAPLWAGFTALVNEQAYAGGRPPAGFLNPAIYAIGQGPSYISDFHDITSGNNTWDQSPANFFAVPGYDLCTGWGTPAGAGLITTLAMPDILQIFPVSGFNAVGGVGGPFTPVTQTLTLTNTGTQALSWTVSNPAPWLDVSASSGTLAPGTASLVTISLNSAATSLPWGTYAATVWFTNLTDSVAFGRQFTLTVLIAPMITSQPSDQAVIYGATAGFSVTADGSPPLSYKWSANGTNLSDGGDISGSATSTLTVSNVTPARVGPYFVTVSNAALVVTSAVANLSIVGSAPVIYQQPASQTVPLGAAALFTVAVHGDPPFAYQWTLGGTNLPGAVSASLSLTNAQFNQSGNYAVAITNVVGGTLSSNAVLTVVTGIVDVATFDDFNLPGGSMMPLANGYDGLNWNNFDAVNGVLGVQNPVTGQLSTNNGYYAGVVSRNNVVFNAWGGEATFGLSSPFNFISAYFTAAWNDGLQVEVKGYLGSALLYDSVHEVSATVPTNIVLNYMGVTEVVFISSGGIPHPGYDEGGTQFVMDNAVVVEGSGSPVNTTPVIYRGPQSVLVSQAQNTNLTVAAVGTPPLAYQWKMNGTNLPGQTNMVLNLTNAQSSSAGSYTVVVTNSFGSTTSAAATVTVVFAPLIVVQPQDQSVLLGDNVNFSAFVMGTTPLSFQWRFLGTNIAGATSAGYTVTNVIGLNAGAYNLVVTNNYGSVTSRIAVLTVLLAPGVISCGSQPVVFFPSSAQTNFILQMSADPGSGNWVTVSNANSWSGLGINKDPGTAFFRFMVGAQTITRISAGFYFTLFMESDGTLWGVGDGSDGQLGDGNSRSFNGVPELLASNITAIAAGFNHTLFVKSDGSLWAMGYNSYGQLGDGTYNNAYLPEQIVASNVTAVAAGADHSLFLKKDGSLWAMGDNKDPVGDNGGQLGDGTYNSTNRPEQIVASNVAAIACGGYHSLFIKSNGSLWTMGYNISGQLGDGSSSSVNRPEQIVAANVTAIAAGDIHSLFLKSDGSLWAMGDNYDGQLGDGTYSSRYFPERIVAGNVTAVAAGFIHSLFLKSDGSLWAMGANGDAWGNHWGQLGDGTYNNTNRPEQIIAGNVANIACGAFHSLFVKSDGSLWTMGCNYSGQLGNGTDTSTNRPEEIIAVPAVPQRQLSLGAYGNQFVLLFPAITPAPTNGSTALAYSVLTTTNLTSGNWVPVANGVPFSGMQITNAPGPVYFRLYYSN